MVLLLCIAVFASPMLAGMIRFEDVSVKAGIMGGAYQGGHAAAVGDVDGDGFDDVYVTNCGTRPEGERWLPVPNALFINNGNGTFREVASERGVVGDQTVDDVAHGAILVDLDADGDLDLLVGTGSEAHANRLYLNDGTGRFTDTTEQAGLAQTPWQTRAVCAADVDADGWPDLYFTNAHPEAYTYREAPIEPLNLFLGRAGATFVAAARGIGFTGFAQGAVMADLTGDGFPDLAQAQWGGPEHGGVSLALFVNDGEGRFADARERMGVAGIDFPLNGVDAGDYDHDGFLDLLLLGDGIALLHNEGGAAFRDVTAEQGLEGWGFSAIFADFDNDTWLDIFVANNRGPFVIYRNQSGHFKLLSGTGAEGRDAGAASSRAASLLDYDRDGRLDLFIARKRDSNVLYHNVSEAGRYVHILLRSRGTAAAMAGAKAWVYAAGYMGEAEHLLGYAEETNSRGYLCQHRPGMHFGVGEAERVDLRMQTSDGTVVEAPGVATSA